MATLIQSAPLTVDDVLNRLTLAQRIDALAVRAQEMEQDKAMKARDKAEADYRATAQKLVAAAEADAMRKRKGDELLLYWLMLMDEEGEFQLTNAASVLGATFTGDELKEFLQDRADLISDFADRTRVRLRETAENARKEGLNNAATMRRVIEEGEAIMGTEGDRLALTEAQATYGYAQLLALQQQGYKTKLWVTMGDDRVRESHVACGNQGEVEIGKPFANGLMYPCDPAGPVDEVCNCRCWLVGGSK